MKSNKLRIALILAFSFVLFSTTAYAKSFTDVLGDSFLLINDFFKNDGYKPYSLIIDFFVFSAVFMAIYMRGVKFAFKEVSKTEKALAVILGFTTAFLLIIGGYSISKLLPFVNWLLYFLLFALIWRLLKDVKSKWARLFLALLLTLLLILIFLALFSATSYRISCSSSALPWLPWLLALLLFVLFWILLKDIKNSFGRFLLALLLTIAVVLLVLFLLKTYSTDLGCPEGPFASNMFDDIGRSFGSVDFVIPEFFRGLTTGSSAPELQQIDAPSTTAPGAVSAPQADPLKKMSIEQLQRTLQDYPNAAPHIKKRLEDELKSRQPPAPAPPAVPQPTPQGPATPETTPPTLKPEPPKGPISLEGKEGFALAGLGVMTVLLFIFRQWGRQKLKEWLAQRKQDKIEKTIPEIIAKIELIKQAKEDAKRAIANVQKKRDQLVKVENRDFLTIEDIKTKKGQAYLYEEHDLLTELGEELVKLDETERRLIHVIRYLGITEADFLKRLDAWDRILTKNKISAEIELRELEFLIGTEKRSIVNIILNLFKISAEDWEVEEDLIRLLKNKDRLIGNRIDRFLEEGAQLKQLLQEDHILLTHLLTMLDDQISKMEMLNKKIQEAGQIGTGVASPEAKILQQLAILNNLIRLVAVKKRANIDDMVMAQIIHHDVGILEMMQDLNAALTIARNPAGNHRELISRFKGINLVGRGTTGMDRPNYTHLWESLEFNNITFPDFVDKLIGLMAAEAGAIKEFLNSLPGGVPVGLGTGGMRINLAPPEGATQKGARRRVPLYERQPFKTVAAVRKGVAATQRGLRAMPRKAKAALVATGVAAAAGGLWYLGSEQQAPPPPPRPAVRPAEKKEFISFRAGVNGKIITVQYHIIDEKNPNAVYNVTAWLSLPGTNQYNEIGTFTGKRPYVTYEDVLDAKKFEDGTYNLVLGAITATKPTIHSYVKVQIGAKVE